MKQLLLILLLLIVPFCFLKPASKKLSYNPSYDKYIKLARQQPKVSQADILAEIAKEWGDLGYDTVITAYRVANCESKFNTYAHSKTADFGVFQINAPTWVNHFGIIEEQLYDYKLNIRLAKQIYLRSGSFRPWVCYTDYL